MVVEPAKQTGRSEGATERREGSEVSERKKVTCSVIYMWSILFQGAMIENWSHDITMCVSIRVKQPVCTKHRHVQDTLWSVEP